MNCIQAQAQLAAYRELNDDQFDTTELDEHLEECASCRQVLARYSLVGDQIQSLIPIEPAPGMHERLMQALAAEHSRFLQESAPETPPPPDFLKPYLKEHIHYTPEKDPLTTFSTAETGPLPVLHTSLRRRRSALSQFAVLGLVAAFLLALMVGGLTSLLLLARSHSGSELVSGVSQSTYRPTSVVKTPYTTDTPYPNVVSAVANRTTIYYTAYSDTLDQSWMLEKLDRTAQVSIPLLSTASANPLIILGSQNGWLVWLQLGDVAPADHEHIVYHLPHTESRTWSLHYLSTANETAESLSLLSGVFDSDETTGLTHTPIQGIWFIQNTLLVAMVDESGISHLMRYQLSNSGTPAQPTEIARASVGHIFTSPTANSDGSIIFWADEWLTADGTIHSDIWTQQNIAAPRPTFGRWEEHTVAQSWLFRADSTSFHPTIVDNTLFLMNTNNALDGLSAEGTPVPTSNSNAPTPTPQATTGTPPLSWANAGIYLPPADEYVNGTLFMLPLGDPLATYSQINTIGSVSNIEGGTDYILWQEDNNTYGMFDVRMGTAVNVGSVLDKAAFVAVNGDTTVWTQKDDGAATPDNSAGPAATIITFNWPPDPAPTK